MCPLYPDECKKMRPVVDEAIAAIQKYVYM